MNGNLETVQLLLQNNIVNFQDNKGWTALIGGK
jgi:hypothetical protein